ncbi:MAG: 30S ribosomal protein S3 [Candidatus Nanohaloarchaea archaeon]
MQEKQFVEKGARKVRLHEFFEEELEGAGYSRCELVRTPTSTKIVVYAQRPGLVIGRGGSRIRELTEDMEAEFGFENPQIEVNEIENADADAEVVAKSMADWLEKGGQPKRVGYTYLRRVKEAGVIGAEIEVAGKLSGNRGRTEKFSYGYVKRNGNTSKENVKEAYELARTKPGAIGVKVRIMESLPEFKHRDVDVEEEILHKTVEHEDSLPRDERLEMVVAEAESMTSSAIDEAMEELEVETEDITKQEIRDVFEERGEEIKEAAEEEAKEEQEAEENEEDEEVPEDVEKESTESESGIDEEAVEDDAEGSEGGTEADYEEIVSGTIADAKDELEDLENPDWEKALKAEKDNKSRTTFIDWLETRVEE